MSKKLAIVAAGVALVLSIGAAQANTKPPSPAPRPHPGGAASQANNINHYNHFHNRQTQWKCYWLPTVNNGSVSGLEQKCVRVN